MMAATNQSVNTPLGRGTVQGRFAVIDDHDQLVVTACIVRLPVNDATKSHLNKSNCLTPRAAQSGLWVFQESEIK